MADHQGERSPNSASRSAGLRGRRLQLIDCQNLFCEVDKYAVVAHPGVRGSDRPDKDQTGVPAGPSAAVLLVPAEVAPAGGDGREGKRLRL